MIRLFTLLMRFGSEDMRDMRDRRDRRDKRKSGKINLQIEFLDLIRCRLTRILAARKEDSQIISKGLGSLKLA